MLKEDYEEKRKNGLAKLSESLKLDPIVRKPPEDVDFKEPTPGAVEILDCDYTNSNGRCHNERIEGTRFCEHHIQSVKFVPKCQKEDSYDDDEPNSVDNPNKYQVDGRQGLFQLQATMYGTIDMWLEHNKIDSDFSMYDRFQERKDEFMDHYQVLLDTYGYEGLMKYISNPLLAWALASGSIGMEKYFNIKKIKAEREL